jgi:hypothetical protein
MSLSQKSVSEYLPSFTINGEVCPEKNARAQKLKSILIQEAKKLRELFKHHQEKTARAKFIEAYYRRYYTMTLKKEAKEFGLHRPPLRDEVLDYPWQVLLFNRVEALKIWERLTK